MNNGHRQAWSATDVWAPGWYADPWQAGRERRWTGNAWTAETRGASGPNIAGLGGSPPAPASPPPEAMPADETPATGASRWNTRRVVTVVAALALIALILGFTVTYVAADTSSKASNDTVPPSNNTLPTPSTTPSFGSLPSGLAPPNFGSPGGSSDGSGNPAGGSANGSAGGSAGGSANGSANGGQQSTDPSANVLTGLVVQQSDVTQPNTVQISDGGDSVAGAATLDLCNGTFASEALRTARLQVDVDDGNGDAIFSTEAVLYRDSKSATQALAELRSVVANCPSSPVVSPVGEPTVTTKFNAAPDTSWPQVAGIQRQAYSFTQTDGTGASQQGVAVYMQRGRALLALYFQNPSSPQPSVAGKTSMQAITAAFAQRLAAVPASAIGA
jgi:hypothetical protein